MAAAAPESLEAAMAGFIDALSRKDVPAFLEFFSRNKPFRFIGTIQPKRQVDLVRFDALARELNARDVDRGWYSVLFDGGPDDSLALTIEDPARRPWRRVKGQKFVPPDDDDDSTLFITWRKENGRWVVDAIGYPGA
jgi:hypothetical protein